MPGGKVMIGRNTILDLVTWNRDVRWIDKMSTWVSLSNNYKSEKCKYILKVFLHTVCSWKFMSICHHYIWSHVDSTSMELKYLAWKILKKIHCTCIECVLYCSYPFNNPCQLYSHSINIIMQIIANLEMI